MDGRVTTRIPRRILALPPVAASVPRARSLVRGTLPGWGLTALDLNARLVTSEFVSNAIRHGEDITLCLYLEEPDTLVVEVWDSDPDPPARRNPDPFDPCGRGLMLVDAYADAWGYRVRPDEGKIIWARLVAGPAEGDNDD